MKVKYHLYIVIVITLYSCKKEGVQQHNNNIVEVDSYITTFDQSYKLTRIEPVLADPKSVGNEIIVNSLEIFQTMDGFGFSLTGGSAQHLMKMSEEARREILLELFGTDIKGVGVSYLRISLGASDLNELAFSYDDTPDGKEDLGLKHFSIAEDEKDLIPILKEILSISPEMKIMASPWSAPTWMKSNGNTKGGSLKKEYFDVYSQYIVRYLKAMTDHGISIDAITIQNEPLHPGNNPSMLMTAEDQAEFIKNSLGPLFKKSSIETKIIIYDHNADRMDYPMTVLSDSLAKSYVDGSAFHLYGGEIENLSLLQEAYPDKSIYFTEQWVGAPGNFEKDFSWHMENLIIGASRNWCKTVLEWNLTSNPELEPHTIGGCTKCLGAITIDGDSVTRNPAYYTIAHASKFVRPGSTRIYSTSNEKLPNVAFLTPNNSIILIVLNNSGSDQTFKIVMEDNIVAYSQEAASAVTYVLHDIFVNQ